MHSRYRSCCGNKLPVQVCAGANVRPTFRVTDRFPLSPLFRAAGRVCIYLMLSLHSKSQQQPAPKTMRSRGGESVALSGCLHVTQASCNTLRRLPLPPTAGTTLYIASGYLCSSARPSRRRAASRHWLDTRSRARRTLQHEPITKQRQAAPSVLLFMQPIGPPSRRTRLRGKIDFSACS